MKRNILNILVMVLMLLFGAQSQAQEVSRQDYEKLKKDYEALLVDRDNILAQARRLLEYKEKYESVEDTIKKNQQEKEKIEQQLKARLEQISLLQKRIEELEILQTQLQQDKESLKNELEKFQIEYKIVPETRKEIEQLKKEKDGFLVRFKQLEQEVKRAEEKRLDAEAKAELYRRQLNDFKKRYEEAVANNRALEKKIAQVPARFAELARENKILIKETALMHYNLGVFYTQNKEYSRAIAEFEKAIELNPDDPYAHYNLGYIYAEYVVNRPKAIEHFRHFLRLAKAEDKDVDWVKKYILTWQTWEAKKPVE
ncbi:MAG: tetratricopeptide repeat protein [Candidatus Omnitrophica bacterium]|nr:tetratricopeptide repeat protein [Candidatus Omnitrophota bacterium]